MKQANVFQPFLFSSFQHGHCLTLSDMRWNFFEAHDFMGDSDDWALVLENMLSEKRPALLEKITFADENQMFCIRSEDKDALHEIAEMVNAFYKDDDLFDGFLNRYAQYEFEVTTAQ